MVIDYQAIATAATTQMEASIPVALTVLGVIIGVSVGVKLFKRFVS